MASVKTKSRKTNKRKTNNKTNSRRSSGVSKSSAARKSSVRKTNARAASGRSRSAGRPAESVGVAGDITLLASLLIAVLILVFNLGFGGSAGKTISNALFGVFGLFAYIVPFYIFFAIAFYLANRRNALIFRKMVGMIMLLVFLCALIQLATVHSFDKSLPISDYYYNSASSHAEGGFIGGAVVKVFTLGFDIAISWILTVFGLIASLIVLTQKPLLTKLGRKTRRTAAGIRSRRKGSDESEDDEDDIDYEDEEDVASARAMRKNALRRAFPLFNLKADRKALEEREAEAEADQNEQRISSIHTSDDIQTEKPTEKTDSLPVPEKRAKRASTKRKSPETDTSETNKNNMPAFLRNVMIPSAKEETSKEEKPKEENSEVITDQDTVPKKDEESTQEKIENRSAIVIEGTGISDDMHLQEASSKVESNSEEEVLSKRTSVKKKKSKEEDIASDIHSISGEISANDKQDKAYALPPTNLLTKGKGKAGDSKQHLLETARKLEQIFRDFGVNVHVNNVSRGPTVTRYELSPEQGVKVSRIVSLSDDIKLNLAASEIRIEAPIPGKAAVGIEVPNKESSVVAFRDLVESTEFVNSKAPLTFAVGKDISGKPVISDIAKMPHLLIAGATGSGKSVCINTLIMSVLMKSTPDEVRMLMIDPKVVELKIYDGIPHLLIPVVTDPKKAAGALNWAVREMNDRYNKFAEYTGVRDLQAYNKRIERINETLPPEERQEKLPQILIIVDELADLMMVAPGEVEDAICRLAQLARAAGLHLVIATQRPSVNVVTGLIKANMPSRIALAVSSGVDSRTIIDMNGAEKLLGHGDMLFAPQGYPKPARVQGAYVSDDEISRVTKYLTGQTAETEYHKGVEEEITKTINNSSLTADDKDDGRDEYFVSAGRLIIEKDKASIGMLQRMFKIGFNRAARIMDQLSEAGVVGPEEGTKPRKILMDSPTFEAMFGEDETET